MNLDWMAVTEEVLSTLSRSHVPDRVHQGQPQQGQLSHAMRFMYAEDGDEAVVQQALDDIFPHLSLPAVLVNRPQSSPMR